MPHGIVIVCNDYVWRGQTNSIIFIGKTLLNGIFKPNVTTHKKSAGARLTGRAKIHLLRSYNPKNI